MAETVPKRTLAATKRDLDKALAALDHPGSGALSNLECRVSDLQNRFISTPAQSLDDIEARLRLIREMVASLGPAGYLLNVVDATVQDVQAMQRRADETASPSD